MTENDTPPVMMTAPHQSDAKKRKVRKGTHSCWECKRRKMRCIFDPTKSIACNPCRRRGSTCISQEFPEDMSLNLNQVQAVDDDVFRNEMLSNRAHTTEHTLRADQGLLTPVSTGSEVTRYLNFYNKSDHVPCQNSSEQARGEIERPSLLPKHQQLSRFLHGSLPSREDTEKLCRMSGHTCVLAHEALTLPFTTLDQNGLKTSESLLNIPDENSHPVLIARYMLQLAVFLQYLHPDVQEMSGLSESPRAMMERLSDLATRLVTTNDELLGSIEGLECVMVEGLFQANLGNLRRSWVTGRRALGIAQLMGLNRPDNRSQYKVLDPSSKFDASYMWYRIVFLDRYLCLLLGVSQGCLDRSMASDALLKNDTPMGRLDRIHCVIASRILERNDSSPSTEDRALTRDLDMQLQKAARSVPSTWWLAPNLDKGQADSSTLYWDTRRLVSQVFHYNLLNQLHLPYMLQASSPKHDYQYSRITCVNASREVLSRFITLRRFNKIAYSCRTVDFLALMSAMTLLLAHLTSDQSESNNLLAHQYHSDRAMIEQAQKNMMEVNRLSSDALSAQSADLLRRLLAIEEGATDGLTPKPAFVSVQRAENESNAAQNSDPVTSVHVPYFGIIQIARDSTFRAILKSAIPATAQSSNTSQDRLTCNEPMTEPTSQETRMQNSRVAEAGTALCSHEIPSICDIGNQHMTSQTLVQEAPIRSSDGAMLSDQVVLEGSSLQVGMNDPLPQYETFPDLAAGGEDWAFQGVDMAFFESLMRSSGEGSENTGRAS